jgi:hypothetical protein
MQARCEKQSQAEMRDSVPALAEACTGCGHDVYNYAMTMGCVTYPGRYEPEKLKQLGAVTLHAGMVKLCQSLGCGCEKPA